MRLRLRIEVDSRCVEEVAVLNSGYEAPSPQLLISIETARRLGLWPPEGALEAEFDTAGGVLRAWIYPRRGRVKVLAGDVESREVVVDLVVSPLASEPLISDMLAEELEIAVESFGRGLWRFRWEPPSRLRESARRGV